jgi:hypothetical protein
MPYNTSRLVVRTQMNQKVMFTSTIHNQNYNSGKRPQNFINVMPTSITQKSTLSVLGLIKIKVKAHYAPPTL